LAADCGTRRCEGHEVSRPAAFLASQLIANGETATYVLDPMGHASIHTTFDTYGHLSPGRSKEASARYEKSMHKARQGTEAIVSNPLAMKAVMMCTVSTQYGNRQDRHA
jgi:hypothetical protein